MSDSQGRVADRYRLTSQIGSGGMGRVWLARDEVLHRDVAVKEVVFPEGLNEPDRADLCERMLREARAAGRLSHPNVVGVYDVVQADGRPWIVMELVRSRSLYQVIKEDGPVAPKRAAEIGLAVLAALRAAHRAGVWHRDVKPGNVLLADDGRVVLTDFGLATFDGDGTVTQSGLILGSAQYISPERAREGASGPESDMWSLGATLYAAVEGRSPYARETSMATLTALATAPPDPPRHAGPLRPILIGLLRKNPRHRMRAAEVERLLRRVVDGDVKGMAAGRTLGLRRPRLGQPMPAAPAVMPASADGTGPAGGAATGGAATGPGTTMLRRSLELRTVTEETFRHVPQRIRRRPWLIAGLALAVMGTASVLALSARDPRPAQPGPPSAPSPPALTAAMRVQACAAQSPDRESSVPDGGPARPGEYEPLPGWVYYRDPAGFHVGVPAGWVYSRVDSMLCFRDPTSPKAIGVYVDGIVEGHPIELLARGESAWRQAAGLTDYRQIGIRDLHFDEGAADLEYSYRRDGLDLHGANRIMRLDGRVFTVYWLTTELYWLTDRYLLDFVQASFGLDP